jgi:hypothetical protein
MTLDTRLLPPKPSFKERYASEWERVSNRRERIAEEMLRLILPLEEIVPTGQGVKSSEFTFEDGSMPDFYVPALKAWFEVTGSDKTQAQSLSICMTKWGFAEPSLFIREGKVFDAKLNRIMSHLIFISVNEADGSVLFIPCAKVTNYRTVPDYEKGGEPYYMIPWRDWLRPYRLLEVLK